MGIYCKKKMCSNHMGKVEIYYCISQENLPFKYHCMWKLLNQNFINFLAVHVVKQILCTLVLSSSYKLFAINVHGKDIFIMWFCINFSFVVKYMSSIYILNKEICNRTGIAGAVLQTPSLLIDWLIDWLIKSTLFLQIFRTPSLPNRKR